MSNVLYTPYRIRYHFKGCTRITSTYMYVHWNVPGQAPRPKEERAFPARHGGLIPAQVTSKIRGSLELAYNALRLNISCITGTITGVELHSLSLF